VKRIMQEGLSPCEETVNMNAQWILTQENPLPYNRIWFMAIYLLFDSVCVCFTSLCRNFIYLKGGGGLSHVGNFAV
jgi:hypothetical protein